MQDDARTGSKVMTATAIVSPPTYGPSVTPKVVVEPAAALADLPSVVGNDLSLKNGRWN